MRVADIVPNSMDMKSIFDPVVGKILALVEGVANEARNKEPSKPVVVRKSPTVCVHVILETLD